MTTAEGRFFTETAALEGSKVIVTTLNGKIFTGTLIGINPDNMSLILGDAKERSGETAGRLLLIGSTIAQISASGKFFDLNELAQRLEKVFPRMVKTYESQGFIMVMDKVKVSRSGVEGDNTTALTRVKSIYDRYMSEINA